jgi:tRNA-Thr(GGU) m(6)t(6)A37 methyltransferase TsaA
MDIKLKPVATIRNSRIEATDDYWGEVITEITLEDHIPAEAFENIEKYSHLEIIFYFDKADAGQMVYSGRPRGNPDYPVMGIFSQRKKDRPNHLGLTTVELIAHNGRTIIVKGLDAIDGTPVLDIKPAVKEFEPRQEVMQPRWVEELMKDYWK